jgi:hypothetical protein
MLFPSAKTKRKKSSFTEGRQANHSLKLTEITACFFAARKKLFREMATRAARIVYDDPATRRRSLAPVR